VLSINVSQLSTTKYQMCYITFHKITITMTERLSMLLIPKMSYVNKVLAKRAHR